MPSSFGEAEGGVANFSEADRDVVKAREGFWSMSVEFNEQNVKPKQQVWIIRRKTIIDDVWNIDGQI